MSEVSASVVPPFHACVLVLGVLTTCMYNLFPSLQDGSLPLHLACKNGDVEVCALLMGAYPEAASIKDKVGFGVVYSFMLFRHLCSIAQLSHPPPPSNLHRMRNCPFILTLPPIPMWMCADYCSTHIRTPLLWRMRYAPCGFSTSSVSFFPVPFSHLALFLLAYSLSLCIFLSHLSLSLSLFL